MAEQPKIQQLERMASQMVRNRTGIGSVLSTCAGFTGVGEDKAGQREKVNAHASGSSQENLAVRDKQANRRNKVNASGSS